MFVRPFVHLYGPEILVCDNNNNNNSPNKEHNTTNCLDKVIVEPFNLNFNNSIVRDHLSTFFSF